MQINMKYNFHSWRWFYVMNWLVMFTTNIARSLLLYHSLS